MKKYLTDKRLHWLGLLLFGILVFILHQFAGTNTGDDVAFREQALEKGLIGFLDFRYHHWTSRILIEGTLVEMVLLPAWVWRLLDTLMMVMIAGCLCHIVLPEGKRKYSGLFSMLLFLIPINTIHSAGYVATTTNYVWPLALGLVAMLPLADLLQHRKTPLWLKFVGILCAVWATNMELMAALVAGFAFVTILFHIVEGRLSASGKHPIKEYIYPCLLLFVGIAAAFFAFSCPGNNNRVEVETFYHFPEFAKLSIFTKTEMGFLSEAAYYFGLREGNFVFFSLISVMCFYLFQKKKYRGILLQLPGFGLLCLGYLGVVLRPVVGRLRLLTLFQNDLPVGFSGYRAPVVLLEIGCYVVLFALLLYGIFLCGDTLYESLLYVVLALAGMVSRFIMGFSPSVYISGYRTAMYMTFCMILLIGILVRKLLFPKPNSSAEKQ